MEEGKRFYTVRDIAREFDRSERTIREAIQRGDIPAVKMCGRWVVSVDVLKEIANVKQA